LLSYGAGDTAEQERKQQALLLQRRAVQRFYDRIVLNPDPTTSQLNFPLRLPAHGARKPALNCRNLIHGALPHRTFQT
jgi:hypothetical protein